MLSRPAYVASTWRISVPVLPASLVSPGPCSAGGLFTQHLSWRCIFDINVPIGIIALFTIAAVLHFLVSHVVPQKIHRLGSVFLSLGCDGRHPPDHLGRDPVCVGFGLIVGLGVIGAALTRHLLPGRDQEHPSL